MANLTVSHDTLRIAQAEHRAERVLRENEERSKRCLKVQYGVMTILSESKSVDEAASRILHHISGVLSWDLGMFWIADDVTKTLKNLDIWQVANGAGLEVVDVSRAGTFTLGKGLPGQIWEVNKPIWISDLRRDLSFSRCKIAMKEGFLSAFGFPISVGSKVLGVLEFFSREVRELDTEMLEAMATLGGQIGQFMNRLAAEKALKQAVSARDEFMSIASHELKTPLTSLKLQAQVRKRILSREDFAAFPHEKIKRMVDDDEKQIDRLTRLVDDMLDISRLTSGQFVLNLSEVNLGKMVQEVLERFQPQLQSNEISCSFDSSALVVGMWDHYRIEQIFTNLLMNAMKYGGGKPIHVSISANGRFARLSVRDQGVGITKENQTKIFKLFERVVSSAGISGLGLGLYIVRQLVEAHDGAIVVESEPGKGSEFTVELPLKRELA